MAMEASEIETQRPPVERVRAASWLVLLGILAAVGLVYSDLIAQVTVTGRGKNFVAPVTDVQGRKTVLRGQDVRPVGGGLVEITTMQAETLRGQQKDMIFEAPQCFFDTKSNVASSGGWIAIHTSDARFSIEGEAFRWQLGDNQASSKLVISNRVHSLVRKRLITPKTGTVGTGASPIKAGSNPTPSATSPSTSGTNDFIRIVSDHFEYQTDRAIYRGQVRAQDVDGDLACDVLTVYFHGENGAVEKIEAERDVLLEQGTTRAQANKAIYSLGQGTNLVEFTGQAIWSDGERQGSGERVLFDRGQRILYAYGRAYLKLPRTAFGESGLVSPLPGQGSRKTKENNSTNSFVEVFSDQMTIDLPLTNGPVRRFLAERNVLMLDPDQEGRALGDVANYEEATGLLKLSGSPMLQSQGRLITGTFLEVDRMTRVLSAAPDAYVKMPLSSVGGKGGMVEKAGYATNAVISTNHFVEIWSKRFEYHTNYLVFHEKVRANFLDGDVARGKLTCDTLTLRFADQIQSFLAEKNVELEQFTIPGDPRPTKRRANCDVLKAEFDELGRLKLAVADKDVIAEMEERRADRPEPVLSRVTADVVTALFNPVTNQADRVVAEKDVWFTQGDRIAHGTKAVYTGADGLMEMTGQPTATMPEGRITEAERLIWDRTRERFITRGKFKSEWNRPAGATNLAIRPNPGAR